MAPYLFPYPITGPVAFSNILLDRSQAYTTELADATVARTRLQVALKAAAGGEPGGSALAVLEAVQVYYPFLRSIITCIDTDDLLFKGDPVFPWRPSLTHYAVSAPLLPMPSIHAEHYFVLLTYTFALSNYAHSILAGLPTFETNGGSGVPNITAEDEKKTSAGLARAVDLLSQAAGVAEWASVNATPQLEAPRTAAGGRVGRAKWPVETGSEAFRALSMLLLADAHVTAIRRLLLPVLGHALFAPPGPPLPSNHPSSALLAKLYLHVASLYTAASALLRVHDPASGGNTASGSKKLFGRKEKTSSGAPDTDAVDSDVVPELRRYLRKESLLASALGYKWLGIDAGENTKGDGKVGEALAWVKEASARLSELEDGKVADKMKGLAIGRNVERRKEARRARQGRIEREVNDTAAWVQSYTKLNDTVAFQPVPAAGTLTLPPGRPIFAAKAFSPPEPKFAPMRRDDDLGGGPGFDDERAEDSAPPVEQATYAGKGSYY